MVELSRHQVEALDRVRAAFADDARVVELGMPGGFGRHQALANLAAGFAERSALVVDHPHMIDLAFGCLAEAGASARAGLLASGSHIEVGTVQRAHDLAIDGRLAAQVLLIDGMAPRHAALAEDLVRICPEALALRLAEPPDPDCGADPESFHFPVSVLETRTHAPGGPSGP